MYWIFFKDDSGKQKLFISDNLEFANDELKKHESQIKDGEFVNKMTISKVGLKTPYEYVCKFNTDVIKDIGNGFEIELPDLSTDWVWHKG